MKAQIERLEKEENKWIATSERLPEPFQTVWLSNGVICVNGNEIVAECESDVPDVKYWHGLPDSCYDE